MTAIRPIKMSEVIKGCTEENTILIIDESQYVKNYNSKIGKLSFKLSKYLKYICLLTGDAISNGYIDYINQLRILGIYFTVAEFKQRYCIERRYGNGIFDKRIEGYRNVDELMNYVSSVAWFVKTHEVAGELPKQIDQNVYLQNTKFDKYQDELINTLSLTPSKGETVFLRDELQLYNIFRQLTNSTVKTTDVEEEEVFLENLFSNEKLEALDELYNDTPDSFIVYYNFNTELDSLIDFCKRKKIKYLQINGHQNDYEAMKGNVPKYKHLVLIQYQAGS